MKVLVTGGAGFIGSHIADKLIEIGHEVVIVDDLSMGKKGNINPHAKFYNLDVRDLAGLEKLFITEKPDIVNHHAAQSDVTKSMVDPTFDAGVNILGSLNIINLSLKYKVKKIIFASTSVVYPEPEYIPVDEKHTIKPISNYGISKYAVECYLRLYYETYGLNYCAFRYGNVYGPRQDPNGESGVVAIFAKQMFSGVQPTIFGNGKKTRDYVYIDDVVNANIIAIKQFSGGDMFNISCEIETTDFEVFDAVRKSAGKNIEPTYKKKRPGELDRGCLANKKAKSVLGWMPKVTFEAGIPLTVKSYRDSSIKLYT